MIIKRAFFIAVIMLAVSAAVGAQDAKGPKIEVSDARFDFGKVQQGREAVHLFEIRNVGDAVLEIQKIQSS